MIRYNKDGLTILEYKKELLNPSYSSFVISHLLQSLLKEVSNLSEDLYHKIADNSMDYQQFEEVLKKDDSYIKTQEEIEAEYRAICEDLKFQLSSEKSYIDVDVSPNVETEDANIKLSFVLNDDFVQNYFYISGEKEWDALMKRRGFVEKFAILRLTRIVKDFLLKHNPPDFCHDIETSPVFFDSDKNVYGIYLTFTCSLLIWENDKGKDEGDVLRKYLEQAIESYLSRMVV